MTPLNLKEIVQRTFPGIAEKELEEMLATSEVREYPPEVILCREGEVEGTFYVIQEGEVEVTKRIEGDQARLLKRLGPGDFFGEMAIVHSAPRAATVKTVTATTVMEIHREIFTGLLERSSSISLAVARVVSKRLRENDDLAIEDLRLKARELAEAYQHLAELEFARKEFLTTIAHELRTPLMTANGFLQVIRSGMLNGEALNAALETVARNLQDITTLTNDILFLQEMALILPQFQPTDLGQVVASAVEQQRVRAVRGQVGLKLDIASGLPLALGDSKSLERAVAAILDNAIKFSPDGGDVLVRAGHTHDRVWVRIQDFGVGIPPEALSRIFDRFFHLDEVGGHLFRGVGLGLSIARQVIEQHRGKITVESALGQGSTFTVNLPLD